MKLRFLLLFFVMTAQVCSFANQPSRHVRVDLVPEVSSARAGSSFSVLLRQNIDEGWHTYWINPGDSGDAPSMSWEAPPGVFVGDFDWPYPERIPYGPLMNFGYHDQVLLPFEIRIPNDFPEQFLLVQGNGRVLVCADICIPEQVTVDLQIPVGSGGMDDEVVELFQKARSLIPSTVDLAAEQAIQASTLVLDVSLPIEAATNIQSIEYFPFAMGLIENSAELEYEVFESGIRLRFQKGFAFDGVDKPDLSGVMVLQEKSGSEVIKSSFTIKTDQGVWNEENVSDISVSLALIFAIVGGLILNLMPCVFPVLSIKILSLLDSIGDSGHSLRLHGWLYTAGVVASFVVVAMAMNILRFGGEAIGWGFQLQSPIFVGLLAYLFFLIGLNFLGVYEMGTSVMSIGGSGFSSGYLSSFVTGVLATVVAAPCTAPFMGAAIGFALIQPMMVSLLIFAALGAGMALPYLLLCYSPTLLERLPAPGVWMQKLKGALSFPMFASVLWLVWVIGFQTGPTGMMQALSGVLLLGFAIWVLNNSKGFLSRFITLISILGAAYALISIERPETGSLINADDTAATNQNQEFQAYSPQALAQALEHGSVFVNFTAAWCITCKVNEVSTLNTVSVRQAMADNNVTYLKADWTSEDPIITSALAEYGRGGVPLYLLYRHGAVRAEVLPQMLTKGIVIDALNRR